MSMIVVACNWDAVLSGKSLMCVVVVTMFVALLCFAMKRRTLMALMGVLLFLFGVGIYMRTPIPTPTAASTVSCDGWLGAFSKSLSAFYPSRGEYEGGFSALAFC